VDVFYSRKNQISYLRAATTAITAIHAITAITAILATTAITATTASHAIHTIPAALVSYILLIPFWVFICKIWVNPVN
jgi:hypothetical protein